MNYEAVVMSTSTEAIFREYRDDPHAAIAYAVRRMWIAEGGEVEGTNADILKELMLAKTTNEELRNMTPANNILEITDVMIIVDLGRLIDPIGFIRPVK